MSKAPGICDPYVKVNGGRVGVDGAGGGEGPCYWTESQGPGTSLGLGPFEVTVTAASFGQ